MELKKSQPQYFLIIIPLLICVISIYKIINAPSEKYWILAIVLSASILIFIFSIFGTTSSLSEKSLILKKGSENKINIKEKLESEKIPDVLDDGWDLPL